MSTNMKIKRMNLLYMFALCHARNITEDEEKMIGCLVLKRFNLNYLIQNCLTKIVFLLFI